jgi:hypothetical protein
MNCAPTPTVATATMAAAAVPTAGCTRRRLRVERAALTVVIVFLHMQFRPRYVSQDCSMRASLSSALATKLLEENRNSPMGANWNADRHTSKSSVGCDPANPLQSRRCRGTENLHPHCNERVGCSWLISLMALRFWPAPLARGVNERRSSFSRTSTRVRPTPESSAPASPGQVCGTRTPPSIRRRAERLIRTLLTFR